MIAGLRHLGWLCSSGRALPVGVPIGHPFTTNTPSVPACVLATTSPNRDGTPPVFREHLTQAEAGHD